MPGGDSTQQLDRSEKAKPYPDLILSETLTLSSSPLQVATSALPPRWGTAPLRSPKGRSPPGVFAGPFPRLFPSPFLFVSGWGEEGRCTVLSNLILVLFLHPRPPGPLPQEPLAVVRSWALSTFRSGGCFWVTYCRLFAQWVPSIRY